jgi:hypothetical protein
MSEGDFKLELENASLRRLLEHAATELRDAIAQKDYSGSYWKNCITG